MEAVLDVNGKVVEGVSRSSTGALLVTDQEEEYHKYRQLQIQAQRITALETQVASLMAQLQALSEIVNKGNTWQT